MNHFSVRLAGRRFVSQSLVTLSVAALAVVPTGTGGAQLVTPKTVAIHRGDQFAIFPSAYAGMAGGGIALDDTLGDPFGNPARAGAIRHATMFVLPFAHGVSTGRGGGSTYPIGAAATAGLWSGTAVFAMQRLNEAPTAIGGGASKGSNQYGAAAVARRFANGLSLGVSAFAAGLNALDGTDLLYAGSDQLVQSGSMTDVRVGLTKDWSGRRLDVVLVSNRSHMEQDVHFTIHTWTPATGSQTTSWSDDNVDKTNVWGAHTQFTQDLSDGWRVAALATANHLSHPEIPNYRIQNIPRDPGSTNAFNVGLGVAKATGLERFAADFVLEPMYSTTWGTAVSDTSVSGGPVVHAGERTVDNRFTFSNVHIRLGYGREYATNRDSSSAWGFQYGLGVYAINYRLRQDDHVQRTNRVADPAWVEWTPTFGLSYRTKRVTWRYNYRRTCGPSDCVSLDVFGGGDKVTIPPAAVPAPGVIAAPAQSANVDGGVVHVHQLVITIPIR